MIIITPKKPIMTADHRQNPTLCPRTGTDKAVMNKGPAKASVVAVATAI